MSALRLIDIVRRPGPARWLDVTLSYGHPAAPHPGAVHYRVLASLEDDWSGWAADEAAALAAVTSLRRRLQGGLTG